MRTDVKRVNARPHFSSLCDLYQVSGLLEIRGLAVLDSIVCNYETSCYAQHLVKNMRTIYAFKRNR